MVERARIPFAAFLACLHAISLLSASAADWPHARGPGYDGKAPDVSVSATRPKRPVVWRRGIGEGFSGCVVSGGSLFTQFQNRSGQYLLCLDAATGAERWRTRVDWPWEEGGLYAGPYSTPTFSDGRVYFTTCGGKIGCADASDGTVLWMFDMRERFGVEPPPFGYACSPLVFDGKVFVSLGEEGAALAALSPKDGSTVWVSGGGTASYSSPLPMEVGGRRMVVLQMRNSIAGFDSASGRRLWSERFSEEYDEQSSWPLLEGNLVFRSSPFRNGSSVYRVSADGDGGAVSAERVWNSKVVSSDVLSGVVVDGGIFVFDVTDAQADPEGGTKGVLKRVDISNGVETWRSDATGYVAACYAGGRLVMFSETGTLIVAEASADAYGELWRCDVFPGGKRCWGPMAFWKDSVFLRGPGGDLARIRLVDVSGESESSSSGFSLGGWLAAVSAGISDWLNGFSPRSFVSPTVGVLLRWFAGSCAALFLAMCASLVRIPKAGRIPFWFSCVASSIFCAWLFSSLSGSFVFTLPAALFAVFEPLVSNRRSGAGSGPSPESPAASWKMATVRFAASRLGLAGFVLSCAAYFAVCRHFFIPAGFAFPFGLIPGAVVFLLLTTRRGGGVDGRGGKKTSAARVAVGAASFFVYFWSAAALILWRM